MKRFLFAPLAPLALLIAWTVFAPARAATVKISDLPIITAPSTNTFIEVADLNAVTKSRKYLLTNLATVASIPTPLFYALGDAFGTVTLVNPTNTIGLWNGTGNSGYDSYNIFSSEADLHGNGGFYAGFETSGTNNFPAIHWSMDLPFYHEGTGVVGQWRNAEAFIQNSGSGTITKSIGFSSRAFNDSTGTFTEFIGFETEGENTHGGNFGTHTSFHVPSFTGTATNVYGLLVEDQTAGSTNFAIKTGLGRVSLGDTLEAGSTNRWKLKSVSEGSTTNITVNINGNDYTLQAGANSYQVFNAQSYGWIPDGTDRTTAATNLLALVSASGGGMIYFPPSTNTYRADGQLFIPWTITNTIPTQNGFAFVGSVGGGFNTNFTTVLDLRYAGTNGGKIESRGNSPLTVANLTLKDGGASNTTPFIHVSNTVLDVHDCTFFGIGTTNQDAIVLGGTGNVATNTVNAIFQGYSTRISHNFFKYLQRGVYGLSAVNSVVISDNSWFNCGGKAAIELDGTGDTTHGDFGNLITGNLIQMNTGFRWGIVLNNATATVMVGNSFWDAVAGTTAYSLTNSFQCHIENGFFDTPTLISGDANSLATVTVLRVNSTGGNISGNGPAANELGRGLIVKGVYTTTSNYVGALTVEAAFAPGNGLSFAVDSGSGNSIIQASKNFNRKLLINPLSGNVGLGIGITDATSTLQLAGSLAESTAVGGTVSLGDTNDVYMVNADAQLITLPTAVGKRGRKYEIWLRDPVASGTITNVAGVTINGANSLAMTGSNVVYVTRSDGTNWWATKTSAP